MRYFICLLLLPLRGILGQNTSQTQLPSCNCGALGNASAKNYVADEKAAQEILKDYSDQLSKITQVRINKTVVVKAAACTSPRVELCITSISQNKSSEVGLILYNDKFLRDINVQKELKNTWVDRHILLHEFGHHVLGHLKDAKAIEALNTLFEKQLSEKQRRQLARYGSSNPLAQELEADIFAVWVLSKIHPEFDVNQLIAQFDPKELENRDFILTKIPYSEHPLFADRLKTMQEAFENMKRKPHISPSRKYFSDMASTAYLELWPDRAVYEVSLIGGAVLKGLPRFFVAKERVDAIMASPLTEWNFQVGLSVSRFLWNRPWFFSLDAYWSRQQYNTLLDFTEEKKIMEDIKLGYVVLGPQVGFNTASINQQWSLRSWRVGVIGNAGLNVFLPIGRPSYTNYLAPTSLPSILPSIAPRVSLGISVARKSFLARNYKLLVGYEPQHIRIKNTPDVHVFSHNFTTTLQYALWRH